MSETIRFRRAGSTRSRKRPSKPTPRVWTGLSDKAKAEFINTTLKSDAEELAEQPGTSGRNVSMTPDDIAHAERTVFPAFLDLSYPHEARRMALDKATELADLRDVGGKAIDAALAIPPGTPNAVAELWAVRGVGAKTFARFEWALSRVEDPEVLIESKTNSAGRSKPMDAESALGAANAALDNAEAAADELARAASAIVATDEVDADEFVNVTTRTATIARRFGSWNAWFETVFFDNESWLEKKLREAREAAERAKIEAERRVREAKEEAERRLREAKEAITRKLKEAIKSSLTRAYENLGVPPDAAEKMASWAAEKYVEDPVDTLTQGATNVMDFIDAQANGWKEELEERKPFIDAVRDLRDRLKNNEDFQSSLRSLLKSAQDAVSEKDAPEAGEALEPLKADLQNLLRTHLTPVELKALQAAAGQAGLSGWTVPFGIGGSAIYAGGAAGSVGFYVDSKGHSGFFTEVGIGFGVNVGVEIYTGAFFKDSDGFKGRFVGLEGALGKGIVVTGGVFAGDDGKVLGVTFGAFPDILPTPPVGVSGRVGETWIW